MEINLQETFHLFDGNNDGYLNEEEFTIAIRVLSLVVEIKKIRSQYAAYSQEQGLSFDHFKLCYDELKDYSIPKEAISEAIKVLDKRKTGFIPSTELKRILSSIGDQLNQQEILDIFTLFGIDEKGVVKVEDFIAQLESVYEYFLFSFS